MSKTKLTMLDLAVIMQTLHESCYLNDNGQIFRYKPEARIELSNKIARILAEKETENEDE